MTRITLFVASVGLSVLVVASQASAEPIRITGGTIVVTGLTGLGTISIVGTRGFSLTGPVSPLEGRVDPFTECVPCLPGATTLSVGAFLGGTVFPDAVATLDGQTYTVGSGIDDPEGVNFEVFGIASLPALRDSGTTITAPFTADGNFFLPFLTERIRGRGIATVALKPFPPGASPEAWEIDRLVRYDFSDPVPEPATLVLVAGGLAAIVRARKKRLSVREGAIGSR